MRAPAVPLCGAVVAGIVLPPLAGVPALLALALVVLGGALVASAASRLRVGSCLVVAAFLLLGNVSHSLHRRANDRSELGVLFAHYGERPFATPRLVTGRLRGEPDVREDATLLLVDVDTLRLSRGSPVSARGGLRVTVRGRKRAWLEDMAAGERLSLWVAIRKPTFFENPGGFDGSRRLELEHIQFLGSVKSGLLVMRAGSPKGLGWIFTRLRRRALMRLDNALRSPQAFGVAAALVTGIRAGLSRELEGLYQRAGIFHVMAISGAHVAIWTLVVHAFLRRVGLSTRTTMLLLLVVLPLYALFCGSRAPVVRAVVMASVLMAARLASLRGPLGNALAVAALGLLLWEPANLLDAGFQLTMSAMMGIVLLRESLARCLAGAGFFAKPLAVSVAAQLGVMPVAAWHFHRLSPAAPLASLAAIPLAATICVLGLLLIGVSGVPLVSTLVAAATRLMVAILTGVAEVVSQLPGASIRVGAPSWVFVAVYVAALVALGSSSKRLRRSGVAVLGVLLLVALVPYRAATHVLELTALDVGHGDAIVVTLPSGGTVLIDGGGLPMSSLDVGESVVLPFLLDHGIRKLDAVIVSHADFDHIGGLATIIREIRVDELWQGYPDGERPAYRALRVAAAERGVPVRTLRAGERFELGGARFDVLASSEVRAESSNDRSIVLRVGFAGRSVLLTGDAEASLESMLLESNLDLRADVLKLAHHGSGTSTTDAFLDAVQPELAIISAREIRNRPIPSPVVLDRLRAREIPFARTDQNGAITVRIDREGRIELSTYLR